MSGKQNNNKNVGCFESLPFVNEETFQFWVIKGHQLLHIEVKILKSKLTAAAQQENFRVTIKS